MKAVIGIDKDRHYVSALNLLSRLRFPQVDAQLIHVGEMLPPWAPGAHEFHETPQDVSGRARQAAFAVLGCAGKTATDLHLKHRAGFRLGHPSAELASAADTAGAELIAIGGDRHRRFSSLFLGSVGRALTLGARQSMLIAKGAVAADGPARAIFATDHSDYANRCLDRLIELSPQGIEHITVVTATDCADVAGEVLERFGAENAEEIGRAEPMLCTLGAGVVERLAQAGYHADFEVHEGYAREVIHRLMVETKADLLIMGSRGHNLWDRICVGSLSMDQVFGEQYPVLLLRAK